MHEGRSTYDAADSIPATIGTLKGLPDTVLGNIHFSSTGMTRSAMHRYAESSTVLSPTSNRIVVQGESSFDTPYNLIAHVLAGDQVRSSLTMSASLEDPYGAMCFARNESRQESAQDFDDRCMTVATCVILLMASRHAVFHDALLDSRGLSARFVSKDAILGIGADGDGSNIYGLALSKAFAIVTALDSVHMSTESSPVQLMISSQLKLLRR